MTDCFRCGDDDHLSRDCPRHTAKRATPVAAPGLPPAPEHHPASWIENAGMLRIPEQQLIDPTPWVEAIREAMQWAPDQEAARLRAVAGRQVAEARRVHAYLPEFGTSDGVLSTAETIQPLPRWTILPGDPIELQREMAGYVTAAASPTPAYSPSPAPAPTAPPSPPA